MAKKRGASDRKVSKRLPKRAVADPGTGKVPNMPPSISAATFQASVFDPAVFPTGKPPRARGLNPAVRSTTTGVTEPPVPLRSATAPERDNGYVEEGYAEPAPIAAVTGSPQPSADSKLDTPWDQAVKETVDRHLWENALPDEDRTANEIRRRLSQHPADIRDTARTLAREVNEQIQELKRSTPNEADRLAAHNDFMAFLEKMAVGLNKLADAVDQAIADGSDGKLEPVFLGTAGKIARQLHVGLMECLEANRTLVSEIPIRVGLFGLGVAFLHSIGADSLGAIGGLTALALRRAPNTSRSADESKQCRAPPNLARHRYSLFLQGKAAG